jgi:siroheme synthase-like protein
MKLRTYYPVSLDLNNKSCLVVGAGDVGGHKAKALVDAGACVTVIAPVAGKIVKGLARSKAVKFLRRKCRLSDVKGCFLVIAATDDEKINIALAAHASKNNILINVVDVPHLCNFIVPSTFKDGPLAVSVSTSGVSPVVAQDIKKKIQDMLGQGYGPYLKILAEVREKIKERYPAMEERKVFYQRIIKSSVLDLIRQKKIKQAKARLDALIIK